MDAATGNEVRRNRTTQTVKTVVHSDYMLKRLLCGYTTTEQVSKLSLRNSKLLRKKTAKKIYGVSDGATFLPNPVHAHESLSGIYQQNRYISQLQPTTAPTLFLWWHELHYAKDKDQVW